LIPLDPAFLRDRNPADIERRLERIVRCSRFEVVHDACGFRILGPAVPYHAIDPFLAAGLTALQRDLRMEDAQSFRVCTTAFDLCLEDSWSGYFAVESLRDTPPAEDVVFIHLDHHTDMMSSLLEQRGNAVVDPADGRTFDARSGADWRKSIESGSIGIGSFVTTLFQLPNRLHVRHINDFVTSDYTTYGVVHATQSYPEIPGRSFATIRKRRDHPAEAAGTYRGGCDPARVLAGMPPGRILVHIDLDYLINDFNGNPCDPGWAPAADARTTASGKINAFFDALLTTGLRVDRWIVATSPGFCSAYHWPWLLECIERGIQRVTPAEVYASQVGPAPPGLAAEADT
jgi:hypothetical protein